MISAEGLGYVPPQSEQGTPPATLSENPQGLAGHQVENENLNSETASAASEQYFQEQATELAKKLGPPESQKGWLGALSKQLNGAWKGAKNFLLQLQDIPVLKVFTNQPPDDPVDAAAVAVALIVFVIAPAVLAAIKSKGQL